MQVVVVVGVRGLEPPASSSRTKRATRLRYTPIADQLPGGPKSIADGTTGPATPGQCRKHLRLESAATRGAQTQGGHEWQGILALGAQGGPGYHGHRDGARPGPSPDAGEHGD